MNENNSNRKSDKKLNQPPDGNLYPHQQPTQNVQPNMNPTDQNSENRNPAAYPQGAPYPYYPQRQPPPYPPATGYPQPPASGFPQSQFRQPLPNQPIQNQDASGQFQGQSGRPSGDYASQFRRSVPPHSGFVDQNSPYQPQTAGRGNTDNQFSANFHGNPSPPVSEQRPSAPQNIGQPASSTTGDSPSFQYSQWAAQFQQRTGSPQPSPDPVGAPYPNWQDRISAQENEREPEIEIKPEKPRKRRDWNDLFGRVFVGIMVVFVSAYMGWVYAPRARNAMTFWPTNTPTPIPPTASLQATATVTPLATHTPTQEPSATPGPISEYWIADGNSLDPAMPDAPSGVVLLNVNNSAELSPDVNSPYWTSSDKIIQDLGRAMNFYKTTWFATSAQGGVRWFMDKSIPEGLYEIFIMDTFYSSGGKLDFSVKLGESALAPLSGSSTVEYMTSQYEPAQKDDVWRSLGIYYVNPSREALTVSSSWEQRDTYTYVSMDRLLIVPRRIFDMTMLNQLPRSGTRYVIDDKRAEIQAGSYVLSESESPAWDDSYQVIMNPKKDCTLTYKSNEPWPIGKYAIYAWMPASKGGIAASVRVTVDDKPLNNDNGEEFSSLVSPSSTEGAWVLINTYTTDRYYERPVKFKVVLSIPADSKGEYPADAIAFVHTPFD